MASKFVIVTKKDCPYCVKLKTWLNSKKVKYKEMDYLNPSLDKSVKLDENFTSKYCDMSACITDTPVIIKNDKEYFMGEIWDFNADKLLEDKAKQIFDVK